MRCKTKKPEEQPLPSMLDAADQRFARENILPRISELNALRALVARLDSELRGMDGGFRAQLRVKYKMGPQDSVDMRAGGRIVRGKKPEPPGEGRDANASPAAPDGQKAE